MMDQTARIRTARLSDVPALAGLCGELGYPSTQAQVRDRLRLLDDPERTLLVADGDDDGLAGFVDVHVQRTVEEDAYGEIGGLVVSAAHRSSGLGSALLRAASEWAAERGLARIWIRANLARVEPHDFYAHLGCRVVKDQRVYEYPP